MSRFNNLPAGDTLDQFHAFYIAPVRHDESEACIVQCEPGEAEFYTIYGAVLDGKCCEWMAVHDAQTPDEIVRIARQIVLETRKPLFYRDETYGCVPRKETVDFQEIVDALTTEIHDELPDRDAEDFRDDDFDNHPLSEMREAFVTFSDYAGLDTARDPYQPTETS